MGSTGLDNDTRGWIMCIVSGIACVVGSSIICIDILIRCIPGQKNFRIQESNAFLTCALSLSFGVMIFSALYGMLPSSKQELVRGGFGDQAAGFIMTGCFVAGFIGIQVVSRLLHQLIPSHVVDCDHSHEEHADGHPDERGFRRPSRTSRDRRRLPRPLSSDPPAKETTVIETNGDATESTPLLPSDCAHHSHHHAHDGGSEPLRRQASARGDFMPTNGRHAHPNGSSRPARSRATTTDRTPSLMDIQKTVMSFVKDTKTYCDEFGPCYGYSDPCGQECFKHISKMSSRTPTAQRMHTRLGSTLAPTTLQDMRDDESNRSPSTSPEYRTSRARSRDPKYADHDHDHDHDHDRADSDDCRSHCAPSEDAEAQHHHHVPTNAFLSIGLQTVIAIALHKFPEGFITYATNHANPSMGFNVFMAICVHNIAEGFAMALPLYMALGSRLKAVAWSAALGGLSQPLGAGVAVLWFKIAHRTHIEIDSVAYACVFAVTAGIMTSVALQLFVESLSLDHNRNLSIGFAFLGMVLLGLSNALVTD